jgi:hypothetical protein
MFVPISPQNIVLAAGHVVISAREVRLYLVSVDVVNREGDVRYEPEGNKQ